MAAHHGGLDDLVVAYYHAIGTGGSQHYARLSIAASRHMSSTYLDRRAAQLSSELAEATDDTATDELIDELARIAANPNIGAGTAAALYEIPQGDIHDRVAANPALGEDFVTSTWRRTGDGALLANPWLDPAVVSRHYEVDPAAAAQHPRVSGAVLRCCVGHPQARRVAMVHPELPDDIVERALSHATGLNGWHNVHRNRAKVTVEQLTMLCLRILDGVPDGLQPSQPADQTSRTRMHDAVAAEIAQRAWCADERSRPVRQLRGVDVPDVIAEVLAARGEHADAVIALLGSGFSGTVGELVDVAGGVTAQASDGDTIAA